MDMLVALVIVCHAVNLGQTTNGINDCSYNGKGAVEIQRTGVPIPAMQKIHARGADDKGNVVDREADATNIAECMNVAAKGSQRYGAVNKIAPGDAITFQCIPLVDADKAGIK